MKSRETELFLRRRKRKLKKKVILICRKAGMNYQDLKDGLQPSGIIAEVISYCFIRRKNIFSIINQFKEALRRKANQ